MPSRAAIYTRVSTAHQAEKYSLPAQRRILRELAESRGWEVVREYEDPGISGETIEARPAFRAILGAARQREFDVLLVIDLDRLTRSRDLRAWAEITETLREGGVRIVTPGQEIDLDDEDDAFMGALFALLSGREKQKILKRSRRGMEEAVRSGKRLGCATAPYGYTYDRNQRRLVINQDEVELVSRVFKEYLAGRNCTQIAQRLDEDDLLPRNSGPWWPNMIRNILLNPACTGFTAWGRTTKRGDGRVKRPRSGWTWSEEQTHDAIVPFSDWERAQTLLAPRQPAKAVNYQRSPYLLTGLIRCSCGKGMVGFSCVREGKRTRYYRCDAGSRRGAAHPLRRKDDAESEVLDAVASIAETPGFIDRARKKVLLSRMRSNTSAARDLDALRVELERVRSKMNMLYNDRLDGRVTAEQWERFNEDLLASEAALSADIEREERVLLGGSGGADADIGRVLEVLRDFRGVFGRLENLQKKQLLRAIVAEVRVSDDPELPLTVRFLSPWDRLLGIADGEEQVEVDPRREAQ